MASFFARLPAKDSSVDVIVQSVIQALLADRALGTNIVNNGMNLFPRTLLREKRVRINVVDTTVSVIHPLSVSVNQP